MHRFSFDDLRSLEKPQTSAETLRSRVGEMIVNSTNCRAKVEAVNPETGEYRLVLQGTLDRESPPWRENY